MASTTDLPQHPPSGSGSAPDPGQPFTLPDFIQLRADGFFVATELLSGAEAFRQAIDQIFAAGFFLSGLDYPKLCYYLYDFDAANAGPGQRIAQCILSFAEERRALYHAVIQVEAGVEYLFEQVFLTRNVATPVYGRDPAGQPMVVGQREESQTLPSRLEFDEMVAHLWQQGIRFGLNRAVIDDCLAQRKVGRFLIACPQPPVPGVDAGVQEKTAAIRRDDHPRKLSGGRVDLTQFQNRYPQIKANTALLMKTPSVPSRPGRGLDGCVIPIAAPRDFDLATLAGEGTEVREMEGQEFIVAVRDGFLSIDAETNQIAIVDKIVNREGVSVRTTGDLALQGDEYEEHGEVQERRIVTGKNLTLCNDVYGTVRSTGGRILLKQNLVGGAALNDDGPISVEGMVSNAQVRAERGDITIQRAENALVIGRQVRIAEASRCVIVADEVDIDSAMGCAIAAKSVRIARVGARASQETAISILLPDLSAFAARQDWLEKRQQEGAQKTATAQQAVAALMGDETVKRYVGLAARLKKGELQLSAEQQAGWKRLSEQAAPKLKQLNQLNAMLKALQDEQADFRSQVGALAEERNDAISGIRCRLEELSGETVVRSLIRPLNAPALASLPLEQLRTRLRAADDQTKELFSDSSGCFTWQYSARFASP
ncbi:flagellar assembly protein A [Chromobacterium subtsugae]|uniref:flagellar assembly protein A n=1 Tax=Chromobacterium subtsugae TaxID=251747 RepID=UPI0007F87957|nr:flagellar assembly protein A [Chromobacterium subtsugae]OBU85362.1 hypothetical protein MY55_17025 [Chromobacterium subtsugae]